MTEQHLITPPDELVQQWCDHSNEHETLDQGPRYIATQAARWGADQELEACVECLIQEGYIDAPSRLRAARRPKPPSDKELALKALASIERTADAPVPTNKESLSLIRRALEQLPNALQTP